MEVAYVGFDEFAHALGTTADKIGPIFEKTAYDTALYIRRLAVAKAPIRTGTLKRSIIADVIPGGAQVSVNELYGTYVEMGTGLWDPRGAHRIYPKNAKVMAWSIGKGDMAFAASTKGMKPQPYFFPAADAGYPFLAEQLATTLSMVVTQLAGGQ